MKYTDRELGQSPADKRLERREWERMVAQAHSKMPALRTARDYSVISQDLFERAQKTMGD